MHEKETEKTQGEVRLTLRVYTLAWPAEMKEGVQSEVQVLDLDSALEVGSLYDAFDAPPKIGEGHPPGKYKQRE